MTTPDTRPERVYYVSHYAKTKVTNVVVARSAAEAIEKDKADEHVDTGWSSEAWPISRPVARWARDDKPENYRV